MEGTFIIARRPKCRRTVGKDNRGLNNRELAPSGADSDLNVKRGQPERDLQSAQANSEAEVLLI